MKSEIDIARKITAAIAQNLWIERNIKTFCEMAYSLDHCIYNITNDVFLWRANI